MSGSHDDDLALGTTEYYANMHKWLQRGLFACLTVLVIEASFTLPALLIWFGWPTLSVPEICDELMKVRYSDDRAECLIPHPLFDPSEGVVFRDSAQDVWGIQPRPLYKRIGYRDLVRFRDERVAREVAARTSAVPATADTASPSQAPH